VKRLIRDIENRLLDAPDAVCLERARLVTEAYRRHASEPMPIRRAMALRHVLDHMTLDLDTNPIFAGNTSTAPRAWMLIPEAGFRVDVQVAIEHADLKDVLDGAVPADLAAFWKDLSTGSTCGGSGGIGHLCGDYDMVVNRGLLSVIEDIDDAGDGAESARVYRRAMRIACQAVIDWAGRYADAARARAGDCSEPTVRRCLRRIAVACRHVPARPARNLFEGLQAILLVHLAMVLEGQGMSVSIGLPDRALRRFADEARDDGAAACELAAGFLLGVSANSYQGRGSKTQAITVGGADHAGQDRANAVTLAFLRACDLCRTVSDPHLFLRWHGGLDRGVWLEATHLLASGRSMPLLVNDEVVAPGLTDMQFAPADAWDYCIIGCNELGVPGRCCQSAFPTSTGFNDLRMLDAVLRRKGASFASMEDVLDGYEQAVFNLVSEGVPQRWRRMDFLAERLPMPFCSACCRGTVRAGDDLLRAMPYQKVPGVYVRGTSNAANVLNVLDSEVFATPKTSLEDLLAGVDAGDERTLRSIADAPKWGRDDNRADRWMAALCERRTRALARAARRHGLLSLPVCHVVRSLHHVDGRAIGATLDGRDAGRPVADSIGPVIGTNAEGPTAAINSVLKLDARKHFQGIYNLNVTLSARQGTAEVIDALARAFFGDGGQELQINVLDLRRLRAALADPQRHRDLVVRVAGLNARFVELSRVEQEEILRRAEQSIRAGDGLPH
jgi:formate C-acetyltransferase